MTTTPSFKPGIPSGLFKTPLLWNQEANGFRYAVSADGHKFLLPATASPSVPVRVIVNWPSVFDN